MRSEPPAYSLRLVGSIVVKHQMNGETLWDMVIYPTQKAKKFVVPVSSVAGADDLTCCNIERREQRRDAVTNVIVVCRSGTPGRIGKIGSVRSIA